MSAQRFVLPFQTVVDAAGVPLPGAQLFFYISGTSTPLDTYSNSSLATPNTNPIIANGAGMFGNIFMLSSPYKVVLKDANDNLIWTADPVDESGSGGSVPTTAALRLLQGGIDNQNLFRLGYFAPGDGGAGQYYWSTTSTALDDGFSVIRPTAISSGSPGRWFLIMPAECSPMLAGGKYGDPAWDSADAINAITGFDTPFPPDLLFDRGLYYVTSFNSQRNISARGVGGGGLTNFDHSTLVDRPGVVGGTNVLWYCANYPGADGTLNNGQPASVTITNVIFQGDIGDVFVGQADATNARCAPAQLIAIPSNALRTDNGVTIHGQPRGLTNIHGCTFIGSSTSLAGTRPNGFFTSNKILYSYYQGFGFGNAFDGLFLIGNDVRWTGGEGYKIGSSFNDPYTGKGLKVIDNYAEGCGWTGAAAGITTEAFDCYWTAVEAATIAGNTAKWCYHGGWEMKTAKGAFTQIHEQYGKIMVTGNQVINITDVPGFKFTYQDGPQTTVPYFADYVNTVYFGMNQVYYDFPTTILTLAANPITTSAGTNIVTFSVPYNRAVVGDMVMFNSMTAVGGVRAYMMFKPVPVYAATNGANGTIQIVTEALGTNVTAASGGGSSVAMRIWYKDARPLPTDCISTAASNPATLGEVASAVVTEGGSGDATFATVIFDPGLTSTATGTATIVGGFITAITVTFPGNPGDYTIAPAINFITDADRAPRAVAVLVGGVTVSYPNHQQRSGDVIYTQLLTGGASVALPDSAINLRSSITVIDGNSFTINTGPNPTGALTFGGSAGTCFFQVRHGSASTAYQSWASTNVHFHGNDAHWATFGYSLLCRSGAGVLGNAKQSSINNLLIEGGMCRYVQVGLVMQSAGSSDGTAAQPSINGLRVLNVDWEYIDYGINTQITATMGAVNNPIVRGGSIKQITTFYGRGVDGTQNHVAHGGIHVVGWVNGEISGVTIAGISPIWGDVNTLAGVAVVNSMTVTNNTLQASWDVINGRQCLRLDEKDGKWEFYNNKCSPGLTTTGSWFYHTNTGTSTVAANNNSIGYQASGAVAPTITGSKGDIVSVTDQTSTVAYWRAQKTGSGFWAAVA